MGNNILVMFIAVEKNNLTLPIKDWMNDKDIGDLLQKAHDNLPESGLFEILGRGHQLYDIFSIRDRCGLKDLNFLNLECATLKGIELISTICSLTIILDELLSAVDELSCISLQEKNDKEKMQIAFEQSAIYHDIIDWDSEGRHGLFLFIKALLLVMSEALASNKVFLYINYLIG